MNWSAVAKIGIFLLMQRDFPDILMRCVAVCEIYYYESSSGLSNDTETDDIELDVCV